MNAGELCSREVYIVRPDEPLSEALALMHKCHVGAVIVVERQDYLVRPIGMVTDRDVLRAQVSRGAELFQLRVGDAMSGEPTTVPESAGVAETIARMSDRGVRRAPVVNEEGNLVGIVSLDDLLPIVSEQVAGLARLIGAQARAEHGH